MKLIKRETIQTQNTLEFDLKQGLPTKNGMYAVWGTGGSGPAIMEVFNGNWKRITFHDYSTGRVSTATCEDEGPLSGNPSVLNNWCPEWHWIQFTNIKGL